MTDRHRHRAPQSSRRAERLDAAPIVVFFRNVLLPISLTLFVLPLVLAIVGLLSSYLG